MPWSRPDVNFSIAFTWSPFGSNSDVSLNDRVLPHDNILFIGNKRITYSFLTGLSGSTGYDFIG